MQPKKILIVYSSRPPIISDLVDALTCHGVDCDYLYADENTWFDRWIIRNVNKQLHNFRVLPKNRVLFAEHPLAHQNFRSERLRQKIDSFLPDAVFLVRGINFNHSVLAQAPCLIGWWVEREERVTEALREAKFFAWYFLISRGAVEEMEKGGFPNVSYQNHVVNPRRFYPIAGVEKKYDLCFVGNWSSLRQSHLEAVFEITTNVAIFGRNWRRNNLLNRRLRNAVKGNWVDGEALNVLYNESRVVLNVTNWGRGPGKARSGMNMRVFEVPASGAFLLSDESRELDDFLTPGEHLGVFSDLSTLKLQLQHYLDSSEERQRVAAKGCQRVRQNYTYDVVARKIIEIFQSLKV